jgi:conserved hypothetical protein
LSIASKIKSEIIGGKITCGAAFLSGVIRGAGSLSVGAGGTGLVIRTTSKELAEKTADAITALAGRPTVAEAESDAALNKIAYEISLSGSEAKALLRKTGIISGEGINDFIPEEVISTEARKKAYLKGLFAAAGLLAVSDEGLEGRSKGYLLEFPLASEKVAEGVKKLLSSFGIPAKTRYRKNEYSVYLKDSEKIGDLITVLGASESYFELQDILVSRNLKNATNRKSNFEIANIDRSVSAAARQTEAILKIKNTAGLEKLDPLLKELAEARLNNPSGTSADLIKVLSDRPTKSGFNHRMRRLIEIGGKQ